MKKQAILRGLSGFPLGIAIGYTFTIIYSLAFGQGSYYPCMPSLIETMGSEINAVVVQTVLSGLLGASFASSSLVWEIDHWSLAKQSSVYFLITAFIMMPVAYLANWMQHTLIGFLIYFIIFAAIFFIIWIIQYFIWKSKINKINKQIKKQ